MAWGTGTTKADAQAYEVGLETEADVDSTGFYLDDTVGPTMEFDAPAWYGEDETYGTQSDWLTGEGLTDAWGTDPGWGMRSTYSNVAAEYLGENPAVNLLVDAKGMLQRGGKPDAWDIAGLGLSLVPGLGPAALKAAKPVGTAIKRSIQDWGKRKHQGVDFDIDQHITATTDPTFKATGFRDTLQGRILEKLGMLPEYKDLNKPLDPMIAGWYDDYVLKGKTIEKTLSKAGDDLSYDHYEKTMRGRGENPLSRSEWDKRSGPTTRDKMFDVLKSEFPESWAKAVDDVASFSPTERALYEAHIREGKTAEEALEATLDAITSSKEFTAEWLPGFKKSIDDNLDDWTALQKTTTELPQNITQLPSAKPIQNMTWREWDDLSDSPFTLSSKQNAIMRAQGVNNPDNVLDHFWGQGARQDFMGWVEEAIAKTKGDFAEELEFVRLRDLKSGYIDEMTPAQLSNDLAWKGSTRSIDHLAVAEKMSWRPDSISHQDWAQFTKDMTMKEVEKSSRKLTFRIID